MAEESETVQLFGFNERELLAMASLCNSSALNHQSPITNDTVERLMLLARSPELPMDQEKLAQNFQDLVNHAYESDLMINALAGNQVVINKKDDMSSGIYIDLFVVEPSEEVVDDAIE